MYNLGISLRMSSFLDNDIKFLSGVGERRASLLKQELEIKSMHDLLYYFPFRYIDRSKVYKISDIHDESQTLIQLKVRIESTAIHGVGAKKRFTALVSDGSGVATLVWFKGINWIEKSVEIGREYLVFGAPSIFKNELSIVHPDMESMLAYQNRPKGDMQGMYSSTEKLTNIQLGSKGIYSLQCNLWKLAEPHITESLPNYLIKRYNLMTLKDALYNIHFPQSQEDLNKASTRLKVEEILGIQLNLMSQRSDRILKNNGFIFNRVGDLFNTFYSEKLPFSLTNAQKRVIKEMRNDTITGHQMNRLLQGDVGSGKTLVALMTMLLAIDNGFQSCMMAPTEILARQHYATIVNMLDDLPITVGVLTGSSTKKERVKLLAELENGDINILIGTHALIENSVQFKNLGLVIIDEQHRFGVEQRAKLWAKGSKPPHILVMTATPIPRTLAMTLYGDLDVSVIDELPPGRKPIKTLHFYDSKRLQMLGFIRQEIAKGRQVYIVYPLIQESEKMDYRDLQEGFESICAEFPPPDYAITAVHGKMKPAIKQENMELFKSGGVHIMVATSVIEVGVDVPNASVMIIESSERFGLSQLHQLRGRVGRGAEQSYCILMSGDKLSKDSRTRLQAMVETNDGFQLAELDLKIRGAGDINGTQQSGVVFDLKLANIVRDSEMIEKVRELAIEILDDDPELKRVENSTLLTLKNRYNREKDIDFSMIS